MRYSIQHKILIAFSVITFIGLASLLFAAYKITEQNTAQIINKDMIGARKNLDLYLKQYFLINNMAMNKASIESQSENLSKGLTAQIGSIVEIYDSKGTRLSSLPMDSAFRVNADLSKALSGETSYTIYPQGKKVYVCLSYPIQWNKYIIGIMKYTKDYSELFDYNKRFKNIINLFTAAIFILIFITSLILSRQIARPVWELIKSSEQISRGEFDLNIQTNSHDEIGELAARFKLMAHRIREQIGIIEKDRDALRESQAQSKAFFDNVTHELKTPLTTILGYAQVIKDNGFSDREFFDKGTNYIINESKRLNHMVVEILELSKASSRDFKYYFSKVDLSGLIRETCDEMCIKGKKYNIDISCNVQDNLFLKGDFNKLKEVLINLIDNSIKYGRVNSIISVDAYDEENAIHLKVRDQGEGIPDEHVNNLCKPFYRVSKKVSNEKGSAGLGLAIVKSIVESHGGTIYIKSTLGVGTEVLVCFEKEQP